MPAVESSLTGMLLIATPSLSDPNFDRTVVLLLQHTDDGALGLVLTRPSDFVLGDAIEPWRHLIAPPEVAFAGGPVSPMAVIALGEYDGVADLDHPSPAVGDGSFWVRPGLATVDLGEGPTATLVRIRVFSGYAGWGGGQLENEIESGTWLVSPAEVADAFLPDPTRLWAAALARRDGGLARLDSHPVQPWLN